MANLRDVAPPSASIRPLRVSEKVWQLNLDQVEAQTGRVLSKVLSDASTVGSSTQPFDDGNVLFSKLRPYLNKVVLPDESGFATTELVPLRPDPEKLERGYLAYYLRSPNFVAWASNEVSGAKMPRVVMQSFWKQKIPLPPLAEQKRIAGILDAADALRAKRRAALAQLDSLTQSLFLDLFGDPVSNPMGWEVMPIGNTFDLKHGFAFKSENFVNEGEYVLLTPGNFFEKGGFRDREEKQRYHNKPVPRDYVLEKGDILVAMTEQAPGLLGSPILVPESGRFLHNQRLGKVIKKIDIESLFIFELMNASSIRARIQKDSTGTKVKHTSPTKIADIEIGLPPLPLQRRFAAMVESIERQKTRQRAHLAELDALFASLQHRAFRGAL